jgi:hypothetical protein
MNTKLYLLPALCLGGAALLLAPARESVAFAKLGGSLGETQRDVRVFDNFTDATANDNVTPASQFPGFTGAELAIWKGVIEWGSMLHGDGTGDVSGNTLGSGGANFDPMWSGLASGVGTTDNNIISEVASCSSGVLAYCETPISNGWKIRFCQSWIWDDGPGSIGTRWDLQGITSHEYGHALGLDHSGGQATMAPSGSAGQITLRSIHSDDIAGIQCLYGVASVTKPVIEATVASAGTLTIYGSEFGSANAEVWFTNQAASLTSNDPIVRVTGVTPTNGGTVITVTIPGPAGPGDVMVNREGTGGSTLSNAFPTDLVGSFGIPPNQPDITSVTPSTIDALIPGTDQTITITGTNLDQTNQLTLGGTPIPSSSWTIVNSTTITLDMPQSPVLGPQDIGASNGLVEATFTVDIVAPAIPKFQFGNGDPLNVVDRSNGIPWIVSGIPGRVHRVFASLSDIPTSTPHYDLEIGDNGTNLYKLSDYTIPASGWLEVVVPTAQVPDPGPLPGTVYYGQTIEVLLPSPFDASNMQSITVVR